jgi:heat shock protein HslJ
MGIYLLLASLNIGLATVNIETVITHPITRPIFIAQTQNLEGTTWKLVRWGNPDNLKSPLAGGDITAQFSQGRIGGSSGCNRYSGSYTTKENQLKLGAVAATKMACLDELMNQESKFFVALDGAKYYKFNAQGQLEIEYETAQGSGIMVFSSQSVRGLW